MLSLPQSIGGETGICASWHDRRARVASVPACARSMRRKLPSKASEPSSRALNGGVDFLERHADLGGRAWRHGQDIGPEADGRRGAGRRVDVPGTETHMNEAAGFILGKLDETVKH